MIRKTASPARDGRPDPKLPRPVPSPRRPAPNAGERTEQPQVGEPATNRLPEDLGSRAFEWEGRVYAFGGRWKAYRKAGRRQRDEALRGAGASHWLRVDDGGMVQFALYALTGERGRLYAAAEAARSRFGGDFLGIFELRAPSVAGGYWVVALSDDVVLADSLYAGAENARLACERLLAPGRRFGTMRLPEGFFDLPAESCGLDDFLDQSRARLRRVPSRRRSLAAAAAATIATLASATVAHAVFGQSSQPVAQAEPSGETLRIALPRPFASACEEAAASGLYEAEGGWSLASASCAPGLATLVFHREGGASEEALRRRYPDLGMREGGREASAAVRLPGIAEEPRGLWGRDAGRRWLRRRLALLDPVHQTWRETASSRGFRFRTQAPLDRWLDVLDGAPGLEVTRLTLRSSKLLWEVEGRLHAGDG